MDFIGTTEQLAALFADLSLAQGKFKPVIKTHEVKTAQYTYQYAQLVDVLDAVRDGLMTHGLYILQSPGRDGAAVTVETAMLHKSGARIVAISSAVPARSDIQAQGATVSYLRRYAVLAMLSLASEDDDGQAAMPQAKAQPKGPPKEAVKDVVSSKGDLPERFKKLWFAKLASLGMPLTEEQRHLLQARMLDAPSLAAMTPEQMRKAGVELKEMTDEAFADWATDILSAAQVGE